MTHLSTNRTANNESIQRKQKPALFHYIGLLKLQHAVNDNNCGLELRPAGFRLVTGQSLSSDLWRKMSKTCGITQEDLGLELLPAT